MAEEIYAQHHFLRLPLVTKRTKQQQLGIGESAMEAKTTLLLGQPLGEENAFALPTFSSGMRSSPATRRRKIEEWRAKRREGLHSQNCVACTPPKERALARLSRAAVAKRCAQRNRTPKEVEIRLDGADVSPLTMVCSPLASPSSSLESSSTASTRITFDGYSPADPAYEHSFDSESSSGRSVESRAQNPWSTPLTTGEVIQYDVPDDEDYGNCEIRLNCSEYEESVVEAYQSIQDVEEGSKVQNTSATSSIDLEVPKLIAAMTEIQSFEWNDSLPLTSPCPERSYQQEKLQSRRPNLEETMTDITDHSLLDSTNARASTPFQARLAAVEGRTVLFPLPEQNSVNNLSSFSVEDYQQLLVENHRLRNRVYAMTTSHDETAGPVRGLYIEVSPSNLRLRVLCDSDHRLCTE